MARRALPLLLAFALAARAGAAVPRDAADYEIILERAPFGPPPPTAGASADSDAAAAAAKAAAEAAARAAASPPPPAPVRLSSLARYDGVASAGLVEISSGRAFVLRPGEGWGPYRLLDADPEAGSVLVSQGTNEFFVALSWAKGQATNLVPSARAPYLTTFRPSVSGSPDVPEHPDGTEVPEEEETPEEAPEEAPRPRTARAALDDGEEAELVRRATVTDPDGTTHVSFRELNRLRVELRRRKAEEARAAALAEAEKRRAERKAAEEEAAAERAAAERERREAVLEALAQGYDVEADIELTDEEAARLREAGFDVPDGEDGE